MSASRDTAPGGRCADSGQALRNQFEHRFAAREGDVRCGEGWPYRKPGSARHRCAADLLRRSDEVLAISARCRQGIPDNDPAGCGDGYRRCLRRVLRTGPTAAIGVEAVDAALARFRGEQRAGATDVLRAEARWYSALPAGAQGEEIEREARDIHVHSLQLVEFIPGEAARADLRMRVSKGTYVRVLAEDIGAALGCGAHVATLHRRRRVGSRDASREHGSAELEPSRQWRVRCARCVAAPQ